MADDPANSPPLTLETLVSLCKRRGFIFPSSEIYGGFASTWDYGPIGVELKRNIKDEWWRSVVRERDDIVGLDTAILMAPRVWEVSGHVENFHDPLIDCRECQQRFRADQLTGSDRGGDSNIDSGDAGGHIRCPNCGAMDSMTEARQFNTMFRTHVGPLEDQAALAYLRPETAQGIFVNFDNVLTATRKRLPFGIAQQGKTFRNEITPGNFIFRTREFEQMEMEFFVRPEEAESWYQRWVELREQWYVDLGMRIENIRRHVHPQEVLSHYSAGTTDLEYQFSWGWDELEGIANRADYDLTVHAAGSSQRLAYFDPDTNEHIVPYVIEPSAGVDRAILAFLTDAYHVEPDDKGNARALLKFHPRLAPIKVAVLPLSRRAPLLEMARTVWADIRRQWTSQYDDSQSIGRRYRRQDEIGTPYCVTVDFDSLEDHAVTIRERDSQQQERVPVQELVETLRGRLNC